MVEFIENETKLIVRLEEAALSILMSQRQARGANESGGLLFSRLDSDAIISIAEVSIPVKSDIRNKYYFKHDKIKAQKTIEENFKRGLHYIGDWHSHPQLIPEPSTSDVKSIKDVFQQSRHALNFMVHIIIGQSENPEDLYVCLTNGHKILACEPFEGA